MDTFKYLKNCIAEPKNLLQSKSGIKLFLQNGSCILSICFKTTPTSGAEILHKEKITELIRCRFDFNFNDLH